MKIGFLLITLCCAFGSSLPVSAQVAGDQWVPFADDSQYFRGSFPNAPKIETINKLQTNYGELDIRGKAYLASANGAVYAVYAFSTPGDPIEHRKDPDGHLDASAELLWEGLLKAARDALPREQRKTAGMSYTKELAAKPLPGREYSVTIGDMTGTTQLFIAESRVFVLLAMGPRGGNWVSEPLFASFAASPDLSISAPDQTGFGPGVAGSTAPAGNSKVFRSGEVTQRPRVLEKPEPAYTAGARKFSITGTVVLRVVFSKEGYVTNLHIIRKLPHGLTKQAVDAAYRIKFAPAEKDGQPVSMWMQLEYNFNLY